MPRVWDRFWVRPVAQVAYDSPRTGQQAHVSKVCESFSSDKDAIFMATVQQQPSWTFNNRCIVEGFFSFTIRPRQMTPWQVMGVNTYVRWADEELPYFTQYSRVHCVMHLQREGAWSLCQSCMQVNEWNTNGIRITDIMMSSEIFIRSLLKFVILWCAQRRSFLQKRLPQYFSRNMAEETSQTSQTQGWQHFIYALLYRARSPMGVHGVL